MAGALDRLPNKILCVDVVECNKTSPRFSDMKNESSPGESRNAALGSGIVIFIYMRKYYTLEVI
jgi:hypothetical protein